MKKPVKNKKKIIKKDNISEEIKKEIRKKEGVEAGDNLKIELEL